ncbi:MAG: VCBS repeat-containing protein [Vicinamibacteria bacterium]|nr:VCBS repeat-containing protein [Vicinamibacteria bacterium]
MKHYVVSVIAMCLMGQGCSTEAQVQTPVLKWEHGGCYSSWCETGWYSSPAVADLDGDGAQEVIAASYSIFIINGEDGSLRQRVDPDGDRVWPGVAIADIDNDGKLEIVTAHGEGYLHVHTNLGAVKWSRRPATSELRGLSLADIDGDSLMEIVVTAAISNRTNAWVYEHNGDLRPGWPQLSNDSGYAAGVYNDNSAIGDVNNDGTVEIVVPSDVHYICAYRPDGTQIPAHGMYGDKAWGRVGVWESLATEIRGWGQCNGVREESYRTNFADGPAVVADVDRNGQYEVVVTGNVYDCHAGYPPSRYNGVYILNGDRSRFNNGTYDWRTLPADIGAPLSEDYNVIESALNNPVVADIDGDGRKEILFPSYDGRMHAFWLDKTEHHAWPYSVYSATEGTLRFASEPVVADLDRDGFAEIIFTSWTQKGSNKTGKLHILNYQGSPLHEISLPMAFGSPSWNGAMAAPTIANIDGDGDLELVINTAHSGVIAYDLPGTANAVVLWKTGRGNDFRNGFAGVDAPLSPAGLRIVR